MKRRYPSTRRRYRRRPVMRRKAYSRVSGRRYAKRRVIRGKHSYNSGYSSYPSSYFQKNFRRMVGKGGYQGGSGPTKFVTSSNRYNQSSSKYSAPAPKSAPSVFKRPRSPMKPVPDSVPSSHDQVVPYAYVDGWDLSPRALKRFHRELDAIEYNLPEIQAAERVKTFLGLPYAEQSRIVGEQIDAAREADPDYSDPAMFPHSYNLPSRKRKALLPADDVLEAPRKKQSLWKPAPIDRILPKKGFNYNRGGWSNQRDVATIVPFPVVGVPSSNTLVPDNSFGGQAAAAVVGVARTIANLLPDRDNIQLGQPLPDHLESHFRPASNSIAKGVGNFVGRAASAAGLGPLGGAIVSAFTDDALRGVAQDAFPARDEL